jgi:hypothetical protein
VALFARSKGGARAVYAVLVVALEAALLCSLTRSSWLGAAVALGALAASPRFRKDLEGSARPSGLLLAAGLAMALAWPASTISSGYTPSVVGRLREVGLILKPGEAYSPWHQRVLIWACAWTMGAENPLTAQG